MKLSDLVDEKFELDPAITGITADSRHVEPGFLFAAISGLQLDGAKFITQAENAGAAAVLAATGVRSALPTINVAEPRRALSQIAARFSAGQPGFIAGITGTNGKTSTAIFAAQIWDYAGRSSGSVGTLGASGGGLTIPLAHTTPEPVMLHKTLAQLADRGVTHLAMEVSSHGLAQFRADGVKFSAAAFSNISQDHLDYHASFDAYFEAKRRLFLELLDRNGYAVVNLDGMGASEMLTHLRKENRSVITTGTGGDINLISVEPQPDGQNLTVRAGDEDYHVSLPLTGGFQAENVLLAAGLVIGSGVPAKDVMSALPKLRGAPGRMMRAVARDDCAAYVDYAHTPDALKTALAALATHVKNRIVLVIGAGGDRDKSKRKLMGQAACAADVVIVTDDNPRSEKPSEIRSHLMVGCPDAIEIADRADAIGYGLSILRSGDVLLVAGKGHETGQIIGQETMPFDDAEVIRQAMTTLGSSG